jgi:hypothetical protein
MTATSRGCLLENDDLKQALLSTIDLLAELANAMDTLLSRTACLADRSEVGKIRQSADAIRENALSLLEDVEKCRAT